MSEEITTSPAVTGRVQYYDYTPEKMLELLTEMKARGRVVCLNSDTGEPLDIEVGMEVHRSLCAPFQAKRT